MCWEMSDSPRSKEQSCPGAMVMGSKTAMEAGTLQLQHQQQSILTTGPLVASNARMKKRLQDRQ